MLSHLFRASSDFARRKASQSAALAVFARDTINGFVTTTHHMLVIVGITALGALAILFIRPDVVDRVKGMSPLAAASATEAAPESASAPSPVAQTQTPHPVAAAALLHREEDTPIANSRQQQWVANWLSKRYRVATDAIDVLVSAAYLTAKEIKLDPLLILSVMAIESGFNPFAESPVGAQGLMQVMSKVHRDKFEDLGGMKAALNPIANIRVGAMILKDYVKRGGSVEAGLKLYVGAGASGTDSGYGAKVLAEYRRLQEVAKGKKVSVYASSTPAAPKKSSQQVASIETSGASMAGDGAAGQPVAKAEQAKDEKAAPAL